MPSKLWGTAWRSSTGQWKICASRIWPASYTIVYGESASCTSSLDWRLCLGRRRTPLHSFRWFTSAGQTTAIRCLCSDRYSSTLTGPTSCRCVLLALRRCSSRNAPLLPLPPNGFHRELVCILSASPNCAPCRSVLQTASKKSLWDMGLQIFCSHLSRRPEVTRKTVQGLLTLIENERSGDRVSRALDEQPRPLLSRMCYLSDALVAPSTPARMWP